MSKNKNNGLKNDALEQVAGGVEVTPDLIERVKSHPEYNAQKWGGAFEGKAVPVDFVCFLLKNFKYDEACALVQKYGLKPGGGQC